MYLVATRNHTLHMLSCWSTLARLAGLCQAGNPCVSDGQGTSLREADERQRQVSALAEVWRLDGAC